MAQSVRILGTHGVPASYGGFETAAENIGLFLARRGWRVQVYCQTNGGRDISYDTWRGMERINVPVSISGWRGTSLFDLISIRHAARTSKDVCLTFGYNTAVFDTMLRLRHIPNVINMDGIEWSRSRWGWVKQGILLANERAGCRVGNHLIADHPELAKYLNRHAPAAKISMITYGADAVTSAPHAALRHFGLRSGGYCTLICRPIPENSILELVSGFSARPRGVQLAVLGHYSPASDAYHAAVKRAASDEVVFLGSVYDKATVEALRFHGIAYLHGHTVGGTNPSLVEAMAAGNPVLAHDNAYNRWVAQSAALYFTDVRDVDQQLGRLLGDSAVRDQLAAAGRRRHEAEFTWERVAGQYEDLLLKYVDRCQAPGKRLG